MKIHSAFKSVEDAVAVFLKRFGLGSLDEFLAKVARAVAEQYGLTVLEFEYFKPSPCMRIVTDDGVFYFKAIQEYIETPPDNLMAFWEYLRTEGLPIPRPRKSRSGAEYISFMGRTAYLCGVVPGEQCDANDPAQMRLTARMLAQFHRAGDAYGVLESRWKNQELASLFEQSKGALGRVASESRDEITDRQFDVLSQAFRYLEKFDGSLFSSESVHRTCIHGDFKVGHVFFENSEISGVIDADFAGHAERMRDLAAATSGGMGHDERDDPHFECQQLFLDEYLKQYGMSDEEAAILPALMIWGAWFRASSLVRYKALGAAVPMERAALAVDDLEKTLEAYMA